MTTPEPRPITLIGGEHVLPEDALVLAARWSERDRIEALAFWKVYGTPLLLALLTARA